MESTVFFSNFRTCIGNNVFNKLERLLEGLEFDRFIRKDALVAVKLHFGERGNQGYVSPVLVRFIVDKIREAGGRPFLTDGGTLYFGTRSDAAIHMETAVFNGFAYSVAGAPVIIADGLRGETAQRVRVGLKHFQEVSLGREALQADQLVVLTHFKLHELTGFGGTLKNIGMGLATREGKLAMHSEVSPYVGKGCTACGLCVEHCPQQAIILKDQRDKRKKAWINNERCIGCGQCIITCPDKCVQVAWSEDTVRIQEMICEYASGVLQRFPQTACFLNFINRVTPVCDCYANSDASLVPDVGMTASYDPIALDRASAELLNKAPGLTGTTLKAAFQPGDDKMRDVYPHIDWEVQLRYGEEIGLGSNSYRLVDCSAKL